MSIEKEHRYYIRGMHCTACVLCVERRLLALPAIKSAKASLRNGEVVVIYSGSRPSVEELNRIFAAEGYTFFDQRPLLDVGAKDLGLGVLVVVALVVAFVLLGHTGLFSLVMIDASSSLPAVFLLGLIAGVSSCGALVGGLVLSLAQQWSHGSALSSGGPSPKLTPHLLFHSGRLIAFVTFGALLGALGGRIAPSVVLSSVLVFGVCLLMIGFGLRMLGVRLPGRLQYGMPSRARRYLVDGSASARRIMPAVTGALTVLLPYGFTASAQGVALLSRSAFQGALVMLCFALGNLPVLLGISFSSVTLLANRRLVNKFTAVAGVMILFFALYHANAQLNVLGVASLRNLHLGALTASKSSTFSEFPPIVDGKQILEMHTYAFRYDPDRLRVRVGIPVRWEIADKGMSGCTNAVIAKDLFEGEVPLIRGGISVKEFIPQQPGQYTFSCWMGMIFGEIEVVEPAE